MACGKQLDEYIVKKIYRLLEEGLPTRIIGERMDIPTPTIDKYKIKWKRQKEDKCLNSA